jgi:hypothetical protein
LIFRFIDLWKHFILFLKSGESTHKKKNRNSANIDDHVVELEGFDHLNKSNDRCTQLLSTETEFLTLEDNHINKLVYDQEQIKTDILFHANPHIYKLRFGIKIYEFYNAPITKFWQTVIFHMIFLICFTYMILVKTPPKPSSVEVFVLIYTFTFGCDKIREVIKAFHCCCLV